MRVAVADDREAVLGREGDDAAVDRAAERRRVEGLDAVEADPRVVGLQEAPQDRRLGAQRIGEQGVGRDREAALLVDDGDRLPERAERRDGLLDEQREQVAAAGRHLLADDDLDGQSPGAGHRPRGVGGIHPLVVGDRDDVELGVLDDPVEDLLDAADTVRGQGVDVEVGAPVGLVGMRPLLGTEQLPGHAGPPALTRWRAAGRERGPTASQIG